MTQDKNPNGISVEATASKVAALSITTDHRPTEHAPPSPLDTVHSPIDPGDPQHPDDDLETLHELSLDDLDARFSNVPLTTLAITTTSVPPTPSTANRISRFLGINRFQNGTPSPSPSTETVPEEVAGPSRDTTSPSAEVTTIPFLLARLDQQDSAAKRASLEGSEKLREDFQRLQQDTNGNVEIDWDFWGAVMADYEQVARTQPKALAQAIQRGVPSALRGTVWQLMSASKDPELERTYAQLLKEQSSYEKAILRDLGRTFPQHAFFMDGQGVGQENLFNVLKAYALYDIEVGYCQGLAFIVAALLLNMPDEEAFCVLVRLMQSYGLRDMFVPEMPGLQLRLFQFDRLVEELLPLLYVHFVRQGVKSSMYCSQWFLTLFSYRFPLPVVFRIFDHIIATGIEAIFGFSLVLLEKNEAKLLTLKFDQILDYMKTGLFEVFQIEQDSRETSASTTDKAETEHRADAFVQAALQVKVTPYLLDMYASEWEELRRVQNAHAVEMDNLRNANRNLTGQVKNLEAALSQMNTDHVEMVKQLVMAKLEREEMESELVKYKILYAELMHQNEDAHSSHRMSSLSATNSFHLSTSGRFSGNMHYGS